MAKPKTLFDRPDLAGRVGEIFFRQGAPGPQALKNCSKIMLEASKILLTDPEEEQYAFQYGPESGDSEFLEEVATFLSKEYGGDIVNSDSLMLTAGATQGFMFTLSQLFSTGTVIFTEDPTYFIAIKILKEDFKMNVVSVPIDEHGIDVNQLDELLTKHRPAEFIKTESRPFWTMVYLITVFNNPIGKSLPPERCRELIRIARKHDVLLFTEDVYNLIHYGHPDYPPERLLTYDKQSDPDFQGNVLSNGSFSKIFGPGLRLGWMESSERIISLVRKSNIAWSGGSFNHYTSKLMTIILKTGFQSKHLQHVRSLYRNRMETLCAILKEKLGSKISFEKPEGGFFVWVVLPEKLNTTELLKIGAEKYLVNFITGASTSPSGQFTNCMRLSISFCKDEEVEEGAKRICQLIDDAINNRLRE